MRSEQPQGPDELDAASLHRLLLEYARLERRRSLDGLSPGELRRWIGLKRNLEPLVTTEWDPRYKDKRASLRFPTRVRCTFVEPPDARNGVITNVSATGVFVRTDEPLRIGEQIVLRVEDPKRGGAVELAGTVVSRNIDISAQRDRGMGIKFGNLLPHACGLLQDLYGEAAAKLGRAKLMESVESEKPPVPAGRERH